MSETQCLVCQKDNSQLPLVPFHFKDRQYWICSQHLPILIHKPQQLAGILPDFGQVAPSDHEDHE